MSRALNGRLSARTALVTGGTRGIGAAIALRLAVEGAEVIVAGMRVAAETPAGCSEYHAVDFTDAAATEQFAEAIAERPIDILVNSAGITKIARFAEIEPADFDRIHAVNVRAPFLLCRALVEGMRERGWGRIVNIGSVFGTVSKAERGSYSASKFALDGLTAALAAEVARDGVLVNTVSPGPIETEMTYAVLSRAEIERLLQEIPIGRLGRPEEIAALVAWLVGPENTYLSGQNVVIDGGFTRT
jgi:NAD(P)-dependent dehydrogenase (short-subunit alcohol dehydrogenase family)